MGVKNRFIAVISALALCVSLCAFTVAALDLDGDGYDDETGEYITPTEAAPIETYASEPETEYTEPETEYTEPETEYIEPETEYTEPETYVPYYENEDDKPYYSDDTEVYVGGGQSLYTIPVDTAPPASLYESDRKIDVDELSESDWKDIAANLKNAGLNDSGGDSFDFIKNNTDASDNGEWMLVVGVVCLLLAAAGIIYTVASVASSRKKLGKAYSHSGTSGAYSSDGRSKSDYGDGYRQEKSSKRSSKYDTAEVNVPKSSGGSRYKSNSKGSRYK